MTDEIKDQFVAHESGLGASSTSSTASIPAASGWIVPTLQPATAETGNVTTVAGTVPEVATAAGPPTEESFVESSSPQQLAPPTVDDIPTPVMPAVSMEPDEVISPFAQVTNAPADEGFRDFIPPDAQAVQVAADIAAADAHAQAVAQAAAWEQANRARTGLPAEDPAQLAAAREDRNRQLGTVTPPAEGYHVPVPRKNDTDKWLGSIGLFVLRLITAAIIGLRGVQIFLHRADAAAYLESYGAPSPEALAWVESGVLLLVAVLLAIGFGTRAAAVVLTVLAIASLVFVQWGNFSILRTGINGAYGELQLLLAGVGIALIALGSGGWAVDGFRRAAKISDPAGSLD
ncbi:MAG: DoxX family protein [Propionibacteriaceae bacterium]|jgi:uncharacterized membrane protein YphA (DoxX/SURF4 family)|nr:DoxX family protein [Propionibacteriaceae bacterium]